MHIDKIGISLVRAWSGPFFFRFFLRFLYVPVIFVFPFFTMFLTIIVVLSVLLESLCFALLTVALLAGGLRGPSVNITRWGILGAGYVG